MKSIFLRSVKKAHVIGMLVLALGFLATEVLVPSIGNAQDIRVAKLMAALKDQTAKLGAPKIDGTDLVEGREAPALYFGSTKMNNNNSVVDAVAEEGGRGTAATLFVKSGDDYIRVATNVSARMGGGRGLGTILTGAPLESIKAGKAYYGKASVLGTPYVSGYEPIKDASGATIGVYSQHHGPLRGYRAGSTYMTPTDSRLPMSIPATIRMTLR